MVTASGVAARSRKEALVTKSPNALGTGDRTLVLLQYSSRPRSLRGTSEWFSGWRRTRRSSMSDMRACFVTAFAASRRRPATSCIASAWETRFEFLLFIAPLRVASIECSAECGAWNARYSELGTRDSELG